MRKQRIDAKTRVIARECLSDVRGPAETAELLSSRLHWDKGLVSENDLILIDKVAGAASVLPTGARVDFWHPDFVAAKLTELARLEASCMADIKAICGRILQVMELRRLEKKLQ